MTRDGTAPSNNNSSRSDDKSAACNTPTRRRGGTNHQKQQQSLEQQALQSSSSPSQSSLPLPSPSIQQSQTVDMHPPTSIANSQTKTSGLRLFFSRYKNQLIFLSLLSLLRIRVRLADCQTMLRWGVQIGHGELGDLQTGCAIERDTMTDISKETIRPKDLDRMMKDGRNFTTSGSGGIPRILHQSYKSTLVPDRVVRFVRSWHTGLAEDDNNAHNDNNWIFVWWTDEDLPWLIETYYPQYLRTFTKMPHPIMKADTARYFVLHHFGGVYADMDIEYKPRRVSQSNDTVSTAETTTSSTSTLGQALSSTSSTSMDQAVVFHGCEDNSLLASSPNSTFFSHVHETWYVAATDPKNLRSVHKISGVDMLGGVCDNERDQAYLQIVGNDGSSSVGGGAAAAAVSGAFDVHHGTNAWRWKTKRADMVYFLDLVIGISIIVLVIWTYVLSTFVSKWLSSTSVRLPWSPRHYSTE